MATGDVTISIAVEGGVTKSIVLILPQEYLLLLIQLLKIQQLILMLNGRQERSTGLGTTLYPEQTNNRKQTYHIQLRRLRRLHKVSIYVQEDMEET